VKVWVMPAVIVALEGLITSEASAEPADTFSSAVVLTPPSVPVTV
jgi:hypothetical protein